VRLRNTVPRTDSSTEDLAESFLTLAWVLGPTGRAAIRKHCLDNAECEDFARLLRVLNDIERVLDWREARLGLEEEGKP
jgi:hypothetical protein